jgi:hypothetical protein
MEKVAYKKLHARPATNHSWDKLVVPENEISGTYTLYKK